MPYYDQTTVSTGTFAWQLPTGTAIFGNDVIPFVHGITGAVAPQMQQASFTLLQGLFQPSGTAGNAGTSEWNNFPGTVTWKGSDSPTFNVDATGGVTGTIAVGAKVKLTHYTEKFFIVTSVGTPSGTVTPMTLYGGTDFALAASGTITSPQYSHMRTPFGFPMSPLKWTVSMSDSSLRTQNTPSASTKYSPGSLSITIPIGAWIVSEKMVVQAVDNANGLTMDVYGSLSTNAATESDPEFTSGARVNVPSTAAAELSLYGTVFVQKPLILASKTTYYPVVWYINGTADVIYFRNDVVAMFVKCVSAYL